MPSFWVHLSSSLKSLKMGKTLETDDSVQHIRMHFVLHYMFGCTEQRKSRLIKQAKGSSSPPNIICVGEGQKQQAEAEHPSKWQKLQPHLEANDDDSLDAWKAAPLGYRQGILHQLQAQQNERLGANAEGNAYILWDVGG